MTDTKCLKNKFFLKFFLFAVEKVKGYMTIENNTHEKSSDQTPANMLNLGHFKKLKDKWQQENQMTRYLENLSFYQLIAESKHAIETLESEEEDTELHLIHCQMILKEFEKRIKTSSVEMAATLNQMIKDLSEQIDDFKKKHS